MQTEKYGHEISLQQIQIADSFWCREIDLMRKEVLPYQWAILNDLVPEAAPSFCMRNFKIAAKVSRDRKKEKESKEAVQTNLGFEVLPEDMNDLKDQFYGFVFQDSDFYKWIEAVSYSLMYRPDEELEKTADEAIEIVCAAQQDNGYLDTYYIIGGMDRIFTNLKDNHELYCMGHLIEGAVAYYEATGKDRLLQAAVRFADYVVSVFGKEEGKCKGYPGHELAEMALLRLYELTRKESYLNLALFFIDQRGTDPQYWKSEKTYFPGDEKNYSYNQSHLPVREQEEAVGHAVRAMYLYCGMSDAVRLTGDRKLWQACRKLWDSAVHEKMYVTGGIGATAIGEAFSFPYDLPNDLAYAETCASIGLIFWAWRMLKQDPDSEYADVMETALYNTVLSGMALDGKSFFYVNPLEVLPEACEKDERKAHVKAVRQKWFGCACCPPNLARTVASIGKYAVTEGENTLWIHLYIGAVIQTDHCKVRIRSGFPWSGEVSVEILETEHEAYTFAFRIPGWCDEYSVDSDAETEVKKKGYLYMIGNWEQGNVIHLHFQMTAQALMANPLVREDIGKTAIRRGPVIYCAEEADNGYNLHLMQIKLPLNVREVSENGFGIGEVVLDVEGKRTTVSKATQLYRKYARQNFQEITIRYIPYFLWNNRGVGEMQVWTRFYE